MSDQFWDEPDEIEAYREYMEEIWEEILASGESGNPLQGKVTRVYFVSKSKGRGRRRRRWKEVEMIGLGNKFQTIKDIPTGRLDSIAEELIPPELVPPHVTPFQFFLDCFRKLDERKNGRKKRG